MNSQDMTLSSSKFSESWVGEGAVMLRAAQDIPTGTQVRALINGVEIGTVTVDAEGGCDTGDVLKLDCTYYPDTGLPCQIRFAEGGEDSDVAPAIDLVSHDQVIALVGYGELHEGELTLADGMLHGTAVNYTNAHNRPPLIGRVNGSILRDVEVTNTLARPGGGATVYFKMAIQATDLTESGARYEVLSLPDMSTVAVRAVTPVRDSETLHTHIVELEEKVSQLNKRFSYALATAQDEANAMHRKTLDLIDGFAEYTLSVVFDRMQSGNPDIPGTPEEEAAIQAFRNMMAERTGEQLGDDTIKSLTLYPNQFGTGDGWYGVEAYEQSKKFSWMARIGTIHNPRPQLETSLISLSLLRVIQDGVFPITILLDGEPGIVETLPENTAYKSYLNVKPRGGPRPVEVIKVLTNKAYRPSDIEQSEDNRELSLVVDRITFHFAY